MKSLMQQFAEARQQRISEQQNRNQATANLLSQAQSDRLEMANQIQIQSKADRSQRQIDEQNRLQIANQDQSQRQQDQLQRSVQIAQLLNNTQQERLTNSKLAAQIRRSEVALRQQQVSDRLSQFQAQQQTIAHTLKQQFRELNAQLAAMRDLRLIQTDLNAKARLADFEANVKLSRLQMALLRQQRLVTETSDRQSRIQFRQENIIAVQNLMQQVRGELQDLQAYIWGESAVFESTNNLKVESATVVSTNISSPNSPNPIYSGEVERFIISYVSQLERPMPLAQLVSDREAVKALLAQGSSTLQIDPSEVLNVLLKMVETA